MALRGDRKMPGYLILLSVVICFLLDNPVFGQVPFSMPLNYMKLNSGYGYRIHPVTGQQDFHKGVDLAARNEPVYAVLDGVITASGSHEILGNYIKIEHGGISTIYGHLSCRLVFEGDTVNANQFIGITGATGRVTGEHLHFAVVSGGKLINPLRFLAALADLINPK